MTNECKIGDKVILSAVGMDNYSDKNRNPYYTLGVIDSFYDHPVFDFHVTWRNGESNVYSREDLHVIKC